MPADFLAVSREKWREIPAGGDQLDRVYSTDLLSKSDDELLGLWHRMDAAGGVADHRGWYQALYREILAGKRVLELGSGLGFDGLHFMRYGAKWTFADIVADNLATVRRVVELKGLASSAEYLWIEDPSSLDSLAGEFDAIWVNGSLHHAPFEIARSEGLQALRRLQPGGRWIELYYPYERWAREGRRDFSEWGKATDGERTPWAEWYDLEKIKRRLAPARTTTLLDFAFGGGLYAWADLRVDDPAAIGDISRSVDAIESPLVSMSGKAKRKRHGIVFSCTGAMWHIGGCIDLRPVIAALGKPQGEGLHYALDLEIEVQTGSVGFGLSNVDPLDFMGREILLDARPARHRLTISTRSTQPPRWFVVRNVAAAQRSSATVTGASLRFSG